jgi:hypothetical protein
MENLLDLLNIHYLIDHINLSNMRRGGCNMEREKYMPVAVAAGRFMRGRCWCGVLVELPLGGLPAATAGVGRCVAVCGD